MSTRDTNSYRGVRRGLVPQKGREVRLRLLLVSWLSTIELAIAQWHREHMRLSAGSAGIKSVGFPGAGNSSQSNRILLLPKRDSPRMGGNAHLNLILYHSSRSSQIEKTIAARSLAINQMYNLLVRFASLPAQKRSTPCRHTQEPSLH